VKLNRSIVVTVALMAGVTSGTCPAQSSTDQQETVTGSGTAQVATAAEPSAAQSDSAGGKSRAQVMRELVDFQNSTQGAEVREIYRGN
jgi:hypothetical protein